MKLNGLCALLAGVVVAAITGGAVAADRPTAFVQKIVVRGNQQVSVSQIVRILGIFARLVTRDGQHEYVFTAP